MKIATLVRRPSTDQGTLGEFVAGDFRCVTIEPPWRDNRRNRSCIPPGRYRCVWSQSPRFGWVYRLEEVPGRSHVLIHAGNFGGDTALGYSSNTLGCILPGRRIGRLVVNGRAQRAVLASRSATRSLAREFDGEPFWLEVRGHDGIGRMGAGAVADAAG